MTRGRRRPRIAIWLVGLAGLGLVAAGCIPEPPADAPITQVSVTTSPGLFPAFSPDVTDYVVRCNDAPVHVSIATPEDHPMMVDGRDPATGRIEADITRTGGRAFEIIDTALLRAYVVRCLPFDFPGFTVTRNAQPQADYYLAAPSAFNVEYTMIFDDHGVPVWWSKTRTRVIFADQLTDGNLLFITNPASAPEVRSLTGELVRTVALDTLPDGAEYEFHDALALADDHFLIVYNYIREGVDLTAVFPNHADDTTLAAASIVDHVVVEVDADGNPVWTWDAYDHIAPSEMDPQWEEIVYTHFGQLGLLPAYDVYHWNSIGETTTGGYLMSMRHTDSVYGINGATGDATDGKIVWKLGGSTTPESLTIAGDAVFPTSHLGGQHDARMLADGSVTLHDNGTNLGRAPRAVRYQLALNDPPGTGGTATLVEQVSDPVDVPGSFCCGSARRLDGGNWVVGFGGTPVAAELDPSGAVVMKIVFDPLIVHYRVVPLSESPNLNWYVLRNAMNAQNP